MVTESCTPFRIGFAKRNPSKTGREGPTPASAIHVYDFCCLVFQAGCAADAAAEQESPKHMHVGMPIRIVAPTSGDESKLVRLADVSLCCFGSCSFRQRVSQALIVLLPGADTVTVAITTVLSAGKDIDVSKWLARPEDGKESKESKRKSVQLEAAAVLCWPKRWIRASREEIAKAAAAKSRKCDGDSDESKEREAEEETEENGENEEKEDKEKEAEEKDGAESDTCTEKERDEADADGDREMENEAEGNDSHVDSGDESDAY
jgi:hypothetical protein